MLDTGGRSPSSHLSWWLASVSCQRSEHRQRPRTLAAGPDDPRDAAASDTGSGDAAGLPFARGSGQERDVILGRALSAAVDALVVDGIETLSTPRRRGSAAGQPPKPGSSVLSGTSAVHRGCYDLAAYAERIAVGPPGRGVAGQSFRTCLRARTSSGQYQTTGRRARLDPPSCSRPPTIRD